MVAGCCRILLAFVDRLLVPTELPLVVSELVGQVRGTHLSIVAFYIIASIPPSIISDYNWMWLACVLVFILARSDLIFELACKSRLALTRCL